ncbi:MAG: hypothetical protein R3A80_04490 [Bdellovibrionota bacterium]
MRTVFLFIFVFSAVLVSQLSAQEYPVDFDDTFFSKTPYSRWMRDPFKNPPGFAKANLAKDSWPKLSSVVIKDDAVPYAVLDGKKYREGQFVDEKRYVSAIGENYVIITEGTFDYELVIPDANRSIAGSKEDEK